MTTAITKLPTYSTAAIKLEEFVTAQSDGLHLAAEGYMTDLRWTPVVRFCQHFSTAEEEVHLNFLHPHGP